MFLITAKIIDMKIFELEVTYTFTGFVKVRAQTLEDAKGIINNHFGMMAGKLSSSHDSEGKDSEGIVNWNFPIHPIKSFPKEK